MSWFYMMPFGKLLITFLVPAMGSAFWWAGTGNRLVGAMTVALLVLAGFSSLGFIWQVP
jgi:hypothetical protein